MQHPIWLFTVMSFPFWMFVCIVDECRISDRRRYIYIYIYIQIISGIQYCMCPLRQTYLTIKSRSRKKVWFPIHRDSESPRERNARRQGASSYLYHFLRARYTLLAQLTYEHINRPGELDFPFASWHIVFSVVERSGQTYTTFTTFSRTFGSDHLTQKLSSIEYIRSEVVSIALRQQHTSRVYFAHLIN